MPRFLFAQAHQNETPFPQHLAKFKKGVGPANWTSFKADIANFSEKQQIFESSFEKVGQK